MRAILIWVFLTVGGGTVVALLRMALYAYLYRRYRQWRLSQGGDRLEEDPVMRGTNPSP